MMTKVVHDTDIGSGLEISGGKLNAAASMTTDAELAAAIAAVTGGGTEPTLIYTNTPNPNSSTIFDDENPPVANDDAFKQNSQYLYVSSDGAQWTWNGTAYITSPQNTTVGAGSSAGITRIFPASPNRTLLSAKATGLFVFEGLRFDIEWLDSSAYHVTLVNTTASPIALGYNVSSSNAPTPLRYAVTVAAGAREKLPPLTVWNSATVDECIVNVVVNKKWYVLRSVAYPSGTSRMVHMALERKV